jgi:diguanylate cyclase (GGDEF)-like protein
MLVRPVTSRLRLASRAAGAGLLAVVVLLGGFAIWSSSRTVDSASQLKRSRLISDAYVNARFAMDDERLLEHEYMVGHGGNYGTANTPGLHARFDGFAHKATTALRALERIGDPADRLLAARLLATQRAYHSATDAVFAAAMMGNESMARMSGSMADESFSRLNAQLAVATEARSRDAIAKLNSLQSTESGISRATLETVPLALLLVAAFALVLRGYRRRVEAYTKAEFERLEHEALIDSLTHLRNHRAFQEDLDRVLANATRTDGATTLVAIDLDNLKQTNDSLGHPVGDERLKALALAAQKVVRAGDAAYRVGGDEFALILPETRALGGHKLVRRLQAELLKITDGRQTAAAGVAEFGPGMDRDSLVHNADLALLEAKVSRREAIVYSPELEPGTDGEPVDGGSLPLRAVSSALARAVDAKDSTTRSHCDTVANTCVLIANELNLEPQQIAKLRVAGLLHDVGKIGVPDTVLNKPGPLTEEEWEVMRTHPVIGHGILQSAGLADQADWVLHHHERVDGTGYPDGMFGNDIPLESRIILVADAFEAMTSDRPYRKACPDDEALEELERAAGTQFDPACVQALRRALDRAEVQGPRGASRAA